VVGGRVLELGVHANRLRASAAVLEIALPPDLEGCLQSALTQVCRANGLDEPGMKVAVRVTASRGAVDGRDLRPPDEVTPNLVVQAWRVDPPSPELLQRGLALVVSGVRRDPTSPLATVKTTSRAEFVYARLEAQRSGADDAVFLTTEGHLAEATSASVFLVTRAGLTTPSLECGIIVGTTRYWVMSEGAPRLGMAVREGRLVPDELFTADEVFLASSVAGIVPVSSVDGRPIGDGKPGEVTMRLRALREASASGGRC
jgi:branched-chain amino acid aminotransferase